MSKESSQAVKKNGRAKPEENEVAEVEVVAARVDGREGETIHCQRDGGGQDGDRGRQGRRVLRVRREAGSRVSRRATRRRKKRHK
jgi:hypothetical protein